MKKEKILKTILIISVLPYLLVLIEGIHAAICGVPKSLMGGEPEIFGMQAFGTQAFLLAIMLCVFGVIPVCLAYQIFYLIRHLRKKKKIKKEEEADS